MEDNSRNMMLAIVISLVVLVGWQYFYAAPKLEAEQKAAQMARQAANKAGAPQPGQQAATDSAPKPAADAAGVPAAKAPTVGTSRANALKANKRVTINSTSLIGSINLKGARIDDIALKKHKETIEKDSKDIVLFSPSGAPKPYYAEFGWAASTAGVKGLPNASTVWSVEGNDTLADGKPVTLTYTNDAGLTFKRIISVDKNYLFTVEDKVANTGTENVTLFPYGLISRHGTPETAGFFILHEGLLGTVGEAVDYFSYDDLEEQKQVTAENKGGWLGITDKYWASALIPDQASKVKVRYSYNKQANGHSFQTDYLGEGVVIPAGKEMSVKHNLFAGAKEVSIVDGYAEQLKVSSFDLLIDWGWFYFLTKNMFVYLLAPLNALLGNFGLAILAVTVIIKAFFFPLANKSYVSMSKMKKVQPEMTAIRERFGDDKVRQQQAMVELYKKEKINPMAGCLPILIQIPVFFSLYKVLFVSIEMRHAPFYGWIKDLAAPDPTSIFNLFGLIPWDVPQFLLIGVWPILMGITMFLQMRMNPAPTDKTQAMIFTWMPVFFTFLLATFPAGLVIYWAWNNFLSILQQGAIMKRQGVKIELWDNLAGLFNKKKA